MIGLLFVLPVLVDLLPPSWVAGLSARARRDAAAYAVGGVHGGATDYAILLLRRGWGCAPATRPTTTDDDPSAAASSGHPAQTTQPPTSPKGGLSAGAPSAASPMVVAAV